jgi:hypothetical protein
MHEGNLRLLSKQIERWTRRDVEIRGVCHKMVERKYGNKK